MTGNSKKKAAKKKVAKKPIAKKKAANKAAKKVASKATNKAAASAGGQPNASKKIDDYIADLDDWRGPCLAEIRKLIHAADPKVVEEWKWMGSPVWSHDGILLVGNAHKGKVKLTFNSGAKLRDPGKVFNAGLTGNKWRAIDIDENYKLNKTAFKTLIQEAVAFNTTK